LVVAAVLLTVGMFGFVRGVAAQDEQSVTAQLEEENDSGLTATAVLTADGDQTFVVVQIEGDVEEGTEGHMFASTCDDHEGANGVFYQIEPVDADGYSETVVDVPLTLLADGNHWIHMHTPSVERGEGLLCGPIPALAADGEGTPAAGGEELPPTGVGTMAGDSESSFSLVLIALAACAGVVAILILRRREPGASGTRD
jgi:hypothetical protein